MKHFILALFLAIIAPVFFPSVTNNIAFAHENAIWIDVRTQEEYDQGHLPDSTLIPYDEIVTNIKTVVKDKSIQINLYCRSGRRASIAKKTLETLGYLYVQNRGSYQRLKALGH